MAKHDANYTLEALKAEVKSSAPPLPNTSRAPTRDLLFFWRMRPRIKSGA